MYLFFGSHLVTPTLCLVTPWGVQTPTFGNTALKKQKVRESKMRKLSLLIGCAAPGIFSDALLPDIN